jgi:hypothetical protein
MIFLVILVDLPVVLAGNSTDFGAGVPNFAGERDCREDKDYLHDERWWV